MFTPGKAERELMFYFVQKLIVQLNNLYKYINYKMDNGLETEILCEKCENVFMNLDNKTKQNILIIKKFMCNNRINYDFLNEYGYNSQQIFNFLTHPHIIRFAYYKSIINLSNTHFVTVGMINNIIASKCSAFNNIKSVCKCRYNTPWCKCDIYSFNHDKNMYKCLNIQNHNYEKKKYCSKYMKYSAHKQECKQKHKFKYGHVETAKWLLSVAPTNEIRKSTIFIRQNKKNMKLRCFI